MDQHHQTREDILTLNQELNDLINTIRNTFGNQAEVYRQWEQTSNSIARHILDQVVRVAVVGAIKSGKSTFVNSLLAYDYLKRGAGVVTSIVTRIRQGEQLKARLFLKTWNEVNDELNQALILFPTNEWRTEKTGFDIRRDKDRQELNKALKSLNRDQWIGQDGLNANSVLLSSYLKGYDSVQSVISSDSAVLEFDADQFGRHRDYVAHDAMAVYLKDVQLDVNGDVLAGNIEMADCQGSDSPNPHHMAMIQDYLLKAHLIIYVISSRTGVRQADIRFLNMIKRMGIGDNMLFICNSDLNEHDSLVDLQQLVERVRNELSLVVPDPNVFSISALFHLFSSMEESSLSEKDKGRLSQWRNSKNMVAFSTEQLQKLKEVMAHKLTYERSTLLLQNQLERLDVTAVNMSQWIQLNRELLQRDAGEVDAIAHRMRDHQQNVAQIQAMIQSTLNGSVEKMNQELKKETERFFDRHDGPVVGRLLKYVGDYQLDIAKYQNQLSEQGFSQTLYGVFQEFKQSVDYYTTETIAPEIFAFTQQQERRIAENLERVAQPFQAMTVQVLDQYGEIFDKLKVPTRMGHNNKKRWLDLEDVKQTAGISLPASSVVMRFSAEIKTEAIVRLGLYNFVRFLRKAVKKAVGPDTAEGVKAIQDGMRKIKRETERSILAYYKDFQENLKFQYLLRLTEVAGERLVDSLTEQIRGYTGDLKKMAATIEDRRGDKTQLETVLAQVENKLSQLHQRLESLREKIFETDGL